MGWHKPYSNRRRPIRRSKVLVYLTLSAVFLLLTYRLVRDQESTASPIYSNADKDLFLDTHATSDRKLSPTPLSKPNTPPNYLPRKDELVLAAMRDSDMSWVQKNLPGWHANIYRVDAHPDEASLTVPMNKGREAMPFLTYLIDRYDTLPEIMVFLHADRYQWHNDNPLYDTVISVNDLQLDYVRKSGYVNLRCVGSPGCPAELKPASYLREHSEEIDFGHVAQYPRKFPLLLPDAKIPEVVGVPCCAQFAVSREQVLKRGREEYERMRQVVVNSELDDETTGRLFEYLWHIVFGKPAQSCPDLRECYCNTYGYCNMSEYDLANQWVSRGPVLPVNWPNSPGAPGYHASSDDDE